MSSLVMVLSFGKNLFGIIVCSLLVRMYFNEIGMVYKYVWVIETMNVYYGAYLAGRA
jgi:hypothetical protein